ncbi:hypothetical protein BHE74_00045179 [Ensete ventricosum]|nr:hypothetical protein BHE74_00045179 [Ensete ventricosum]
MLSPEGQPPVTQPVYNLPRFPPESDQAPLGNAARRPTSIAIASVHSLPDPDILSSDSTDSLRAQLRLMSQRIDDVHKTMRMKDERGESPLYGSPFIQEIQDTPIPQHFRLPTLEAYDGGSDPMEHVVTFWRMTEADHCITPRDEAKGRRAPRPVPRPFHRGDQGHSRRTPVVGYPGFHDQDQAFSPLLVAHGIREKGLLKTPNPMRNRAKEWDCGCYCRFHYDYGHDTEECYDLKNQNEDLICRGHLDRYIRKPHEPSLRPKGPVERQVYVIIGGLTAGGDNSSARKAYARAKVQKRPQARDDPGITFESESEYQDHDDALVIMTRIANARVRRIMIDTRSSVDIL